MQVGITGPLSYTPMILHRDTANIQSVVDCFEREKAQNPRRSYVFFFILVNYNIRLGIAKTQHGCLCSLEINSQKLAQHRGAFTAPIAKVKSCTLNRFLHWIHP